MTTTTITTASQKADNFTAGMALFMPAGWHKMSLPQKLATAKLVKAGTPPAEAAAEVLKSAEMADLRAKLVSMLAAEGIKASSRKLAGSWQPAAKDRKGRLVWLWHTKHASRAVAQAMAATHLRTYRQAEAEAVGSQ